MCHSSCVIEVLISVLSFQTNITMEQLLIPLFLLLFVAPFSQGEYTTLVSSLSLFISAYNHFIRFVC